jgi:RNA polymerase sigma factor (sigma-70 family)
MSISRTMETVRSDDSLFLHHMMPISYCEFRELFMEKGASVADAIEPLTLSGCISLTGLPDCRPGRADKFTCARMGCPVCMETLFAENMDLIWTIIRQQTTGNMDRASLIQEGRIGLWQAVMHYDPERGGKFSRYACKAIYNQISQSIEQSRKADVEFDATRLEDYQALRLLTLDEPQNIRSLKEALDCLDCRLRQVIVLNFGLEGQVPHTLIEIGEQMGISQQRALQLRNKALDLLRLQVLSPQQISMYKENRRKT